MLTGTLKNFIRHFNFFINRKHISTGILKIFKNILQMGERTNKQTKSLDFNLVIFNIVTPK